MQISQDQQATGGGRGVKWTGARNTTHSSRGLLDDRGFHLPRHLCCCCLLLFLCPPLLIIVLPSGCLPCGARCDFSLVAGTIGHHGGDRVILLALGIVVACVSRPRC